MDIRAIRKRLNMTQKEFADAIGVDKSVVYKYEHGLTQPSKNRREKIVSLLYDGDLEKPLLIETESLDPFVLNNLVCPSTHYILSYLRRLVIRNSNGCCELCGEKAPFKDKDNLPFLYLYALEQQTANSDYIKGCVALCPNCFAKINVLADENDINLLIEKASRHNL